MINRIFRFSPNIFIFSRRHLAQGRTKSPSITIYWRDQFGGNHAAGLQPQDLQGSRLLRPQNVVTTRVLFLSDSVEGRRNFPHMAMYLRVKCRLGGRNMVPVVVWPTLILRGVSQPTPNAPEVPRAIGMCLNIASGHVRRYFDISEVLDKQCPPIFAI